MALLETQPAPRPGAHASPDRDRWWSRLASVEALALILVVLVVARPWLLGWLDSPLATTMITLVASIVLQALPFLVLGTTLSAAITAFVPPQWLDQALSKRPVAAVPVAGAAGMVVATGACGSVPATIGLLRRGVAAPAALTFLLASPAINPVVLVATAVAFPGHPVMAAARFVAGLVAAAVMGWLWLWLGQPDWLRPASVATRADRRGWATFWALCRLNTIRAGGFLAVGAATVALLTVSLPARWLEAVAANSIFSVIALALLAVLLSIRSPADAFVAASLGQFSLTARLAFLVVGPMVNLKLFATQVHQFGPRFALRFAPATLGVAIIVSALAALVFGLVSGA